MQNLSSQLMHCANDAKTFRKHFSDCLFYFCPHVRTALHRAHIKYFLDCFCVTVLLPPLLPVAPTCLFVQSSDRELWTFVSLNLALVYLRTNRQEEFMAVLNTVEPESLSNTSYVVLLGRFCHWCNCVLRKQLLMQRGLLMT